MNRNVGRQAMITGQLKPKTYKYVYYIKKSDVCLRWRCTCAKVGYACMCVCVCFLTEMRKSEVRKRNVISKKVNKLLDIMSHVHTHTHTHRRLVTVPTCTCLTFAFVLAHVGLNLLSHSLSSISTLSDWCVDHVRKLCWFLREQTMIMATAMQKERVRERNQGENVLESTNTLHCGNGKRGGVTLWLTGFLAASGLLIRFKCGSKSCPNRSMSKFSAASCGHSSCCTSSHIPCGI